MNDKILETKDLSVTLEGRQVIQDISLSIERNTILAIIGPNGAGKSVLLRTLLGLVPHSGEVKWQKGVKIGYVPQKVSIEKDFPLSVIEFLKLKKNADGVEDALQNTGLKGHQILHRQISDLSGGELQRVLIAWAIIGNPDILLFDEPLTGIDIGGEETIYHLLGKLKKERGTTIILVSHDISVVYKYADTVLCLNKKQICLGKPNEVINKDTEKKLYSELEGFYKHDHEHHK
ncbi:MAG TPA: metal ABC transporter ATP-binding protein [Candidatus Paceibacterota bacterium]|nr:metal ABC transporter ATP-binding protein [Candidatus Paceibacterota bacterium]